MTAVLAALTSGAAAVADCYDAPMWRGEPLTEDYILAEQEAGASDDRLILLEVLRMAEPSVEVRRELLWERVEESATEWENGVLRETELGLRSAVGSLGTYEQMDMLWVHGCFDVARDLARSNPFAAAVYWPVMFASADPMDMDLAVAALQSVYEDMQAASPDSDFDMHDRRRLMALRDALENPDTADAALAAYADGLRDPDQWLAGQDRQEQFFPGYLANLDEGVPIDLVTLDAVRVPIETLADLAAYHQHRYHAVGLALWAGTTGRCRDVMFLMRDLLRTEYVVEGASALVSERWRLELEAVVVRCARIES